MTAPQTTENRPVRLRVAPSPTGDPHVGTAYMALFDMAYAHRHGGQFILRIEDTDQNRYIDTSEQNIYEMLRWAGLSWDEGPDVGGPCGPYRQSERLATYREYAEDLIEIGHAYRCWCSTDRLKRIREEAQARKEPPKYDRFCYGKTEEERRALGETSERSVVRMLVPDEGVTAFDDLIRGRIEFENRLIDDQVLLKGDGFPTYHLAVVVDDHLMKVSHVTRGEEWISSTPKHVLLYQWLELPLPTFAHFPLLRNENKSKISKRKNPWSTLGWFREQGFLPEALLNFLALMGWSMPDGREIFTLDEFIRHVDLGRISPTGPIFDLNKLDWLNGHYIRQLSLPELADRVRPFLERAGIVPEDPPLEAVLPLIQERLKRLGEAPELLGFFYADQPPSSDLGSEGQTYAALLVPKGIDRATTVSLLDDAIRIVSAAPSFEHAVLESGLRELAANRGVKTGQLFMSLRVASTFSNVSPPLFETMEVLGRERVVERLETAKARLNA
ncbi:MAG TPA: glutamate--tRNA ligase [Chloroflexota bacterium]|nr:glutamate--tRNA ligase [Chloroflexota bacterium]